MNDGADPTVDPLAGLLEALRVVGVAHHRCCLAGAWATRAPADGLARLHYLREGQAWLRPESGEWLQLSPGDLVLLPHGTAHEMSHAPRPGRLVSLAAAELAPRIFDVRCGVEGPETSILCSEYRFGSAPPSLLLPGLPVVIHLRDLAADPLVELLLRALDVELARRAPLVPSLLGRLSDVLVAHVLRRWVETADRPPLGWLAAARDARIGRVLAAIHADPGARWTVPALAGLAGASRGAFTETFTRLVGRPPARYVAEVRMHAAGRRLQAERRSIAKVAAELGYGSESAFSRAFKRHTGRAPSLWEAHNGEAMPADSDADNRHRTRGGRSFPAPATPPSSPVPETGDEECETCS